MKTVELAAPQKGCWRKIPISLIDSQAGVLSVKRLLTIAKHHERFVLACVRFVNAKRVAHWTSFAVHVVDFPPSVPSLSS